jgi:outer membrane lipoprotein SlyB
MTTQTIERKSLHPLAWIAGIALILFSAAGIAAFMDWIPTSMGASDKAALEAKATASPAANLKVPAQVHSAPIQTADRTDRDYRADRDYRRDREPVRTAAICAECGVIESVREVATKGSGSGIGAVGGAVVGGLLGNQVGGGHGKGVMTVVGVIGGGLAGNEVEKRVKSTKSYSIAIRMDDGSTRSVSEASAPSWRTGDKVRIVNGVIQSNA